LALCSLTRYRAGEDSEWSVVWGTRNRDGCTLLRPEEEDPAIVLPDTACSDHGELAALREELEGRMVRRHVRWPDQVPAPAFTIVPPPRTVSPW
jgi:hypothetical protein